MYHCKNCGAEYTTDEAVMCVKCGVARDCGDNYCHYCGELLSRNMIVCLKCGVPNKSREVAVSSKSKLAAGLLGIFLGSFGIHNFYLGYTKKAVTQLVLTIIGYVLCCVGIGILFLFATSIWGLVEGIMILAGKSDTDAEGKKLKD